MTFLRALLYLIALPALTAVLLGYFGSVHPSLDSLAHFRLHLGVFAAIAGLLLMLVRRKAVGVLVLFSALFPLAFHTGQFLDLAGLNISERVGSRLQPLIGDRLGLTLTAQTAPAPAGPRYTLLHANLRFDNEDAKSFLRLAGEANADVMTLNEVSRQWLPHLETLKAAYPHQLVCSADSVIGGVAILSKRPFVDNAENGCSNAGALALQHVDLSGREAVVGAAHLPMPWPHRQPQQITEMRERLRANGKAGLPLIFAGDLNAAPWSHAAKRLASFLNAKRETFPGGSWLFHEVPAQHTQRFGLPIDNVLTRGIEVTEIGTVPPFGSDHLAVRLEFGLSEDKLEDAAAALSN